jgi:HAE1 family hydrophobic/amphiphilic exporter-1
VTVLILVSPAPLFVLKLAKVDPFPQEASRTLFLAYHLQGSHAMQRVEQAVKRMEAYLEANKERLDLETYYTVWLTDEAHTRLYLAPKERAKVSAKEVMDTVTKEMPEIIIGKPSFQFDDSAAGSSNFSLQLAGESTERMAEISFDVAQRLVVDPRLGRSRGALRRRGGQVIVDRDRCRSSGSPPRTWRSRSRRAMRATGCPSCGPRTARSRCGAFESNPTVSRSKTCPCAARAPGRHGWSSRRGRLRRAPATGISASTG